MASPRHAIVATVIELKRLRHKPDDKRSRGNCGRVAGGQGMRGEVDLSVLEPFTTQEIHAYIDYLWRSGATDVAAAVVAALRSAMPDPPDAAALSVMGGSDPAPRSLPPAARARRIRPHAARQPDAL